MTEPSPSGSREHTISVVIPVYQGEKTLTALVDEIRPLVAATTTPDGHSFRVAEVLLVFDNGPDGSADVVRRLGAERPWVRPIWLSRNFGQHAATLAGMASSGSDWIVTMDEDGQHSPADIARLVDTALRENVQVVYASPNNAAPHGAIRNAASAATKWIFTSLLSAGAETEFSSFRLVLGEVGRSVAAYAGPGVFLDVALSWVAGRPAACEVALRAEGDRPSGYSYRSLLSHFWRLVLSSGTRALRIVSLLGIGLSTIGAVLAVVLVVVRLSSQTDVQGWTSVMVVTLFFNGILLFSLGVIAEYIGVSVNMAMGKPLYLIVGDPEHGPLARGERTPTP